MALCVSAFCCQRRPFHPRWVPGLKPPKGVGGGAEQVGAGRGRGVTCEREHSLVHEDAGGSSGDHPAPQTTRAKQSAALPHASSDHSGELSPPPRERGRRTRAPGPRHTLQPSPSHLEPRGARPPGSQGCDVSHAWELKCFYQSRSFLSKKKIILMVCFI